MRRWLTGLLLFLYFLCATGIAQNKNVTIDFPGVEIEAFLKWVGIQTGKRFIYEDTTLAKKKVHIVSSEPIPEQAIFPLCLSVLEANGYTAILVKGKHANIWKIIPISKAPSKPIPIVSTDELDKLEDEELFISQLVVLRYINAQNILSAIQQANLVSGQAGGSVVTIQGTNAILITDFVPNVRRIVSMIQQLDKPPSLVTIEELEQIQDHNLLVSLFLDLRHINAQNVLTALQNAKLVSQQGSGGIVTIQGTNAVLITDTLANVKRIVLIIKQLDKPQTPIVTMQIRLRYASAKDVSQRIEQFVDQGKLKDSQASQERKALRILADERTNTLILCGEKEKIDEAKRIVDTLDSKLEDDFARNVLKTYILENSTPAKILPTLTQLISAKILEPSGYTGQPLVSILANDHANALVIRAPTELYPVIINLIKELDIRTPQVLLEVAVVEFTPSDLLALGVELQTIDAVSKTQTSRQFAATQFGFSSLVDQAGQPIEEGGLPDGKVPAPASGLTTFITKGKGDSIPILIRALQTTSKTEVHAVPRILTNDNEEAEIVLEDEVPVIKTTVDEGTTIASFQEYVKAGARLKIRPQISKGDYLRLEITQRLDAFIGVSNTSGSPPPKTSRSIQTKVTVPDGKTVILGGLTGRREVETVDKVPFLGDIPVLGYLFQSRSKNVSRTSLYVFITPKIIKDPSFKDLEEESKNKHKEMEEFRRKFKQKNNEQNEEKKRE